MNERIIRAAAFPIAGIVGVDESEKARAERWKEWDAAIADAWQLSTNLANWAIMELLRRDVVKTATMKKLPKRPKVYLYGIAFSQAKRYPDRKRWEGSLKSANCVLRAVEKHYCAHRWDILWRGNASLAHFRHPTPYRVHNDDWHISYSSGHESMVNVPIPGRGRFTLRLRGGQEFRRQLAMFGQLLDGMAKPCELMVYRKGKHTMVKLVGWFPRPQPAERLRAMTVTTDPNAFWVVTQDGFQPTIFNADQVLRLIEAHRCFLQRIAEDTKHEKRWPRQVREHMNKARELRCRKQNDRLNSFCHQMTKELTGLAQRRKVATVLYDDSPRGYVDRFPWFKLRTMLTAKLEAVGIKLISSKGEQREAS